MTDYIKIMHQMLAKRSNGVKSLSLRYTNCVIGYAPLLCEHLQVCCDEAGVCGTILLHEGINGTSGMFRLWKRY